MHPRGISKKRFLKIVTSGGFMSLPIPEVWHVIGYAYLPDGTPFHQGKIKAFDINNGVESQLGETGFSSDGSYTITYSRWNFQLGDVNRTAPNVIVRVYDYQERILWQSNVIVEASSEQTLNITLSGSSVVNDVWTVAGNVGYSTSLPLTAGTVLIYDVYNGTEYLLGQTTLNSAGYYTFTYSKSSFQHGSTERNAPVLLLRVRNSSGVNIAVYELKRSAASYEVINIQLKADTTEDDGNYKVYGTVVNSQGYPLSGKAVSAYCLDYSNDAFAAVSLGTVTSDDAGEYLISYDPNLLPRLITGSAAACGAETVAIYAVLTVKDDQKLTSSLVFNASQVQEINFTLAQEATVELTEFGVLQEALSKYLASIIAETKVHADTKEEYVESEKIAEFLSTGPRFPLVVGRECLDSAAVKAYFTAYQIAYEFKERFKATDLQSALTFVEFFYGLVRMGLADSSTAMQSLQPVAINDSLLTAIGRKIIASSSTASSSTAVSVSDFLIFWRQLLQKAVSVKPLDDDFSMYTLLLLVLHGSLDTATLSSENKTRIQNLLGIYYDQNNDARTFLNYLTPQENSTSNLLSEAEWTKLEFVLDLCDFGENYSDFVIEAFLYCQDSKSGLASLKGMLSFALTDWASIVKNTSERYCKRVGIESEEETTTETEPGPLPDTFLGANGAEQQAIYARKLLKAIIAWFPQQKTSTELATSLSGSSSSTEWTAVTAFLQSNDGKVYSLDSTNLDDYLAENSLTMDESTQESLRALQRVYRLTTNVNSVAYLLKAELDSAYKIAQMDEDEFLAKHCVALGGMQKARQIYRLAAHYSSEASMLVGKYHSSLNLQGDSAIAVTRGITETGKTSALTKSSTVAQSRTPTRVIANWKNLFGALNQRSSTEQSILSPSAYLVDLMDFLRAGDGYKALKFRRPDLWGLELTTKNAEAALPTIDLAIEMLEALAAKQALTAQQTSWEAADLRARPEHPDLFPAAYGNLANAYYPWTLPCNFQREEARLLLEAQGLSWKDVELALPSEGRRRIVVDVAQEAALQGTPDVWTLWGLEQSGNSILRPDKATVETGSWDAILSVVAVFLDRSGLTFQQLLDLLETKTFTGCGVSITGDAAGYQEGNVDSFSLVGLTADFARKVSSFVRRMRLLEWSMEAVDESFALGLNDLDVIQDLHKTLNVPVLEVLAWGQSMEDDFFESVFKISARDTLYAAFLSMLETGSARLDLDSFARWMCARLGLSRAHLDLILERIGMLESGIQVWTRSTVESIYRIRSLSRSLKLTVPDYLKLSVWMSALRGGAPWKWSDCRYFLEELQVLQSCPVSYQKILQLAREPEDSLLNDAEDFLSTLAESLDAIRTTYALPSVAADSSVDVYLEAIDKALELLNVKASENPSLLANTGYTSEIQAKVVVWLQTLVTQGWLDQANVNSIADISVSPSSRLEILWQNLELTITPQITSTLPKVLAGSSVDSYLNAIDNALTLVGVDASENLSLLALETGFSTEIRAKVLVWLQALVLQGVINSASTDSIVDISATHLSRLAMLWQNLEPAVANCLHNALVAEIQTQLVTEFAISEEVCASLLTRTDRLSSIDGQLTALTDWLAVTEGRDSTILPAQAVQAYVRMAKAAVLVQELDIQEVNKDTDDLANWMSGNAAGVVLPHWNIFPTLADAEPASWKALRPLVQKLRVTALLGFRDKGYESLTDSSLQEEIWEQRLADINLLLEACGLKTGNEKPLADPDRWDRFYQVLRLFRRTNALPDVLRTLQQKVESGSWESYILALTALRNSLMSSMTIDTWRTCIQGVSDSLRSRKRDALAAYVCWRSQHDSWYPREFFDCNDLYNYYLIDVKMEPDMQVSRIRQALNVIQLFVQRSLLGLEGRFALTDKQKEQWEWMKQYRLWEANRKVFLYAENWIEPDLRDDKSPFFKELENALLESGDNVDSLEEALAEYLAKIKAVSSLEIIGACKEKGGESGVQYTLHVVGRTRGVPHVYYYRRYLAKALYSGEWTPWEKIDADIQGSVIIPTLLNQRLYLAWPLFQVSQDQDDADSTSDSSSLGSSNVRSKVEMRLEWIYFDGKKWSGKKTSKTILLDVAENLAEHKLDDGESIEDRYHFQSLDSSSDYLEIKVFKTSFDYTETSHIKKMTVTEDGTTLLQSWKTRTYEKSKQKIQEFGWFQIWADGRDESSLLGGSASYVSQYPPVRCRLVHNCWVEDEKNTSVASEIEKLIYPQGNTILEYTPGQHKLLPVNFAFYTGEQLPFFFMDDQRTYFVQEVAADSSVSTTGKAYKFELLSHPLVDEFYKRYRDGGLEWLYTRDTQTLPVADSYQYSYSYYNYYFSVNLGYYLAGDWQAWDLGQSLFEYRYCPKDGAVAKPYPHPMVDFSWGSANSIYNWELFFHVPLLLACKMTQEQKYENAMEWFQLVFDPRMDLSVYERTKRWAQDLPKGSRFWRFLPFFANKDADDSISEALGMSTSARDSQPERAALRSLVDKWKNDPFNPHLIARYRNAAYQKFVVMKYLDNLIAWADQLFQTDTMESINEAVQLYILAAEILGPKSAEVPDLVEQDALTVQNVLDGKTDALGNILVDIENQMVTRAQERTVEQRGLTGEASQLLSLTGSMFYFGIPRNDKLLAYWDTVADRLYKIRNSLNFEGIKRVLALYAPPIDPGMLVKAKAAGLDVGAVLSSANAPMPLYRFQVMHQKAVEIVRDAQSLGSTLLSTLEKKDGETLSLLRTSHEKEMLTLNKTIRNLQIEEAQRQLEVLQKNQETTQARYEFYRDIEKMSAMELSHILLTTSADAMDAISSGMKGAAGAMTLLPNFLIGALINGFGGPSFDAETGGDKVGKATELTADALAFNARIVRSAANIVQTQASYERRWDDWKLQEKLAKKELASLEKQILAAQIRIQVTEKELANLERQIEQVEEVYSFMSNRFTNQELFQWLATQLGRLYSSTFQLALDVAKRAERCYQFELGLGTNSTSFIQSTYWDGLRKGLLAGERLLADLRRMEIAFMEKNRRELEITKPVSLAMLSAPALRALQETGSCTFDVPEVLFDMDFPGHYFRRIKGVRLEIPCAAGPNVSIGAKLTLLENKLRHTASLAADYDKFEYVENRVGVQSIASGQAQNDGGLFEFNFRDERYLPFEGAGVISKWKLDLPSQFRQFDYRSIADVVLHVSYTAREGGDRLKAAAEGYILSAWNSYKALSSMGEGLVQEIRLGRDFYDTLQQMRSGLSVSLSVDETCFPHFVNGSGKLLAARVLTSSQSASKKDFSVKVTLKDAEDTEVVSKSSSATVVSKNTWIPLWSWSADGATVGLPGTWTLDASGTEAAVLADLEDLMIELRYAMEG